MIEPYFSLTKGKKKKKKEKGLQILEFPWVAFSARLTQHGDATILKT